MHRIRLLLPLLVAGCAAVDRDPSAAEQSFIQLSLTPGVQAIDDDADIRALRLGLAGARNRDVAGVDLVLGVGRATGRADALQVAGAANLVDGDSGGVQLSMVNLVDGAVEGVQVGGLYNHAGADVGGVQASLLNTAEARMGGVQVGVAGNFAGSSVDGIQLGLGNMTRGDLSGLQVGLLNHVGARAEGLQLGIYNRSGSGGTGVQAGVVNIAGPRSGLQIGLWNVNPRGFLPAFPLINFSL